MPIRFSCPHCRQKLSVSSRKAGTTANCPRCKRCLTIPEPPPEQTAARPGASVDSTDFCEAREAASAPSTPAALELSTERSPVVSPSEPLHDESAVPAGPPPAPSGSIAPAEAQVAAASLVDKQTRGVDAVFTPDTDAFDGIELVYGHADVHRQPAAPPVQADLIAVPRYALYLQGGLIAVVALLAFTLGMLAGGSLLTPPAAPAEARACVISGSIMYASGPRNLADEGAVIALLPQTKQRPDEKAPAMGLRPTDPMPDPSHRGIAILRQLGGGYARADTHGHFQVRVPGRGRYLVLVVAHEKRARAGDEISAADMLKLAPFFDNVAELLGDRRYQLSTESLRGDLEIVVVF